MAAMPNSNNEMTATEGADTGRTQAWFAAGGVIGAVLASSCCIAPLLLLALGVSGAWIGDLTALAPFKPVFLGVALVFIGLGSRQVYSNAKPTCEDGSYCAKPHSAAVTKAALWIATVLVLLAASIDWWAPLLY